VRGEEDRVRGEDRAQGLMERKKERKGEKSEREIRTARVARVGGSSVQGHHHETIVTAQERRAKNSVTV
jgi:hypothetical protein